MNRHKKLLGALLLCGAMVIPSVPAAAQCGETITRLGGSSTAIVRGGVKDAAGLLQALENPRVQSKLMDAIRQGMALEGHPVDRDRDFRIYGDIVYQVKKLAEANARPRDYARGAQLLWMAYVKDGEVALLDNPCWGGNRPMQAWEVPVRLDGRIYQFILPRQCVNLSAQAASIDDPDYRPPQPPSAAVCRLRATADNDTGVITLDTTGSVGDVTVVSVTANGRTVEPLVGTAGTNRWRFPAQGEADNADYVITAEVRDGDQVERCEARVTLAPPTLDSDILATLTDDNHIDVRVTPEAVDVDNIRVEYTLNPSGRTGSEEVLDDTHLWMYPTSGRAKPGSYNFVATVTGPRGAEAVCRSADVIVPLPPYPTWTLRAFGLRMDTSSDTFKTSAFTANGIPVRDKFHFGDASGYGLGLEFRPTQKIGVEASALFADVDAHYVIDIGELWGMDDAEADFTAFTLGLNYHALENSRFDLFFGPFIGTGGWDDVEFNTLGNTYRFDLDGEFLWGAQLGFDWLFSDGGPWAFTSAVRYLETSVESEVGDIDLFDLDVDGVMFSAGISYRFPR